MNCLRQCGGLSTYCLVAGDDCRYEYANDEYPVYFFFSFYVDEFATLLKRTERSYPNTESLATSRVLQLTRRIVSGALAQRLVAVESRADNARAKIVQLHKRPERATPKPVMQVRKSWSNRLEPTR